MRNDRATLVAMQPALSRKACPLVPHDRLIHSSTVYVATQQCPGAIVLGSQPIPVVQELRGRTARNRLVESAERIVAQRIWSGKKVTGDDLPGCTDCISGPLPRSCKW